jgi:acetyl-CoA synthetase
MLFEQYLEQSTFQSYEDFIENWKLIVPDNFNFAYDVVDKIATESPDKRAIVWCDDIGNEKIITFAELKEKSDNLAHFISGIGIKKGDPVMLILRRKFEYWYCLVALHKIGAVAIPATHMLSPRDITYRNKAADIRMIISLNDEKVLEHIDVSHPDCPSLEFKVMLDGEKDGWISLDQAINDDKGDYPRPEIVANDPMLLYFTSGTTGYPKMVRHSYSYPIGHILTAKYWQHVEDDGIHFTLADTGWAKSAWGKIYGQWLCGAAVMVYEFERFDPSKLLGVLEKYQVNTFCAPPTVYRYLIQEDIKRYDLSALHHCTVAGEPLNPEVFQKFYNATGLKLAEGYGQTEMTVTVGNFEWFEPKPGSMGKPSPGYVLDLLDEEDKSVQDNHEGQIVVRTKTGKPVGMFDCYYRDKLLSELVWNKDVYYTGDVAARDDDGYMWFAGRVDDLIKTSGYLVSPFEVESVLIEHPAVLECAVTGMPDPVRGQVVRATVVLTAHYEPSDDLVKHIQEHVKSSTAPYKYPRIIEFVEQLPKTISGKIRRKEIRQKHENKTDKG